MRVHGRENERDKYSGFDEVPWERFRSRLEEAWRTPPSERKAASGRPPWDAVKMFKALVMGRLNNLSDEKLASELRSDLPLMRFIGMNSNTGAPSAKTLWKYRDELCEVIEDLFAEFNECLAEARLVATEGHIVVSTTVKAPEQRNSRDGKRTVKGGGTLDGWKGRPAKPRQKGRDARWLKEERQGPLLLQDAHARGRGLQADPERGGYAGIDA